MGTFQIRMQLAVNATKWSQQLTFIPTVKTLVLWWSLLLKKYFKSFTQTVRNLDEPLMNLDPTSQLPKCTWQALKKVSVRAIARTGIILGIHGLGSCFIYNGKLRLLEVFCCTVLP